jgi:hypothetical protein
VRRQAVPEKNEGRPPWFGISAAALTAIAEIPRSRLSLQIPRSSRAGSFAMRGGGLGSLPALIADSTVDRTYRSTGARLRQSSRTTSFKATVARSAWGITYGFGLVASGAFGSLAGMGGLLNALPGCISRQVSNST